MGQGLIVKVLTCWEKIQLFAESREGEAAIFAGGKLEFALIDIINMYHSSLHTANIVRIDTEKSTTALRVLLKINLSILITLSFLSNAFLISRLYFWVRS